MMRWLIFTLFFLSTSVGVAQGDLQTSIKKLQDFNFKEWDSVEYHGNVILRLTKANQHYERGLAYKFLGNAQWTIYYDLDSALSLFDVALSYFNILGDSIQLAKLYNNYGVAHKSKANYKKSLESFSKAFEYYPTDSSSKFSVKLLINIGDVNHVMSNYDESEKYFKLAYEKVLLSKDSTQIGNCMLRFGRIASAKNEPQRAIDYYTQSLKFYSFTDNTSGTIMEIGREYHLMGELEKAIPYYREAIKVGSKFKGRNRMAINYLNLGEAILTLGKLDADDNIGKAIELATVYKQKRILLHAHEFLAWYFEEHNKPKLALDHFRKFKIYNDSVLNEGSLAKLNSLNVKFNTAQKEKQLIDQELEIEQKNISLIEERNQKILIAIVLVFFILLGVLFYLRARMKQKANVQQAIILEKETGLKAVFVATETERQRISKDLHDGVGQQLSGIKMQLESLELKDSSLQKQKERITENLLQASQEIRQISHQMMPRSLVEDGLIPTLEDLFNKTFSGTSINCSFEQHNANQRYPKDIELSLYRITQELISNIIKHANANNVVVQLFKIKNKLIMTMEDDGVGFDINSKKTGHGLLNIKSRIETINGNVVYESSDKSETVITLSIPLT